MNKCEICKNEIKDDSQFIENKWFHNSCILNLQQRIDKAVEYIKENIGKDENGCGVWWYSLPDYTTPDELLSILKGENNE